MANETENRSYFDGSVLGNLGTNILTNLMIFFSLSIATPWAVCYRQRWVTQHTVVDGHRLTFDGTGGQLFGNYIKWFLLTIITCFIYSLWLAVNMQKWIAKHTHANPQPEPQK